MAEIRGELDLYNQWFSIADVDRDGVLSGSEAVQFFLRSGLPQHPTLFKIWQYVAGDRPSLIRQEFYTAMKLVSLAQLNGGVLDDSQAMRLVNGLAGPIQPPAMQGLAIPKGIDVPLAAAPPGGAAAAAAAAGGLPKPPVAVASPAGVPRAPSFGAAPQGMPRAPSFGAAPPGVPRASSFGSAPAAAVSVPAAVPGAAPGGFPPLMPEQATAFQTAFTQLDQDRDGFVQGTDCFGAFMQSGLPKEVLKSVWDLVAGDAGQLSRHQFVQALYLIDCVKRGIPLPPVLPAGQFPPVAGVNIGQMMGTPSDIYSGLAVPPMMPRAVYQPPAAPPVASFPSQVPTFDAGRMAALEVAERTRLEQERAAALAQEQERKKAEEERMAAQAKREFFTAALTELRLAQSNVTRAVVEAQQRCEMEKAEAERMEGDYSRAYAEFSVKHAQSAPLVEALKKVQEEKAALAAKVESLRGVVAQLESVDPEWEQRERGECEALNQEIAGLAIRKEELQLMADAVERRRGELAAQIDALKGAASGVEEHMAPLKEAVDKLAGEAAKEGEVVVGLLRQLAPLYNKLYDAAKQAMVPLPAEALASIKREAMPFKFNALAVAGADSWGDFKDEGFKIVAALPTDTRLTTFTSPALAAAAAEGSDPPADLEEEEAEREGEKGSAAAAVSAAPAAEAAGPEEAVDVAPALAAEASGTAETLGAVAAQLGKRSSTAAAEEEAVQAAAEAGVLASAIAEALAGSRPGSKASSRSPSKQGSTAHEVAQQGFAVTFEASESALPGAAAAPAAPAASIDAFAEGFESLSLSPNAGENGSLEPAAAIEIAPAPAAPKADAAPAVVETAAADIAVAPSPAAPAAEAAPAEDWTAF